MIERTIYSEIEKSIRQKPVTLITGARQVGKTTLCKKLSTEHSIRYVTLKDRATRELAVNDPEQFLDHYGFPLIIDEIQFAPQLFETIETRVDQEKFANDENSGMYVLTGSQAYNLMEKVTESMAGRVSVIRMSTLSTSEIIGRHEEPFTIDKDKNIKRSYDAELDYDHIIEMIFNGSYPEMHVGKELTASEFYSDYVDTYIDRDISQMLNVRDKEKFHSFMQVTASLTGQELVYDNIAKNVGIDMKTCKSWMSVLIAGDIVHFLQPYSERSTIKRVVKHPKLYFWDTGLACHLARIPDAKTLMSSYLKGPMVETFIINEIEKTYRNKKMDPSLYYYRSSKNVEVDFVMIREGKISLVECKSNSTIKSSEINGFNDIRSNYADGGKCVICLTSKPYPIKPEIYALPISSI